MQKGIFTLPTYITSLYSSKRQLSAKLTEGEIQSANGTKQLYKKGGLVTALSGNPCNWVPYDLNIPRTFKSTFLVFANAREFRFLRKATQGSAPRPRRL